MWLFPHQQAEKSPQNQHVLSILQVGSHQLQYRFFRTNKPKSRYKTNTFCPITQILLKVSDGYDLSQTGNYALSTHWLVILGLRVKMCVWLGVSRGLDLAFLNAD